MGVGRVWTEVRSLELSETSLTLETQLFLIVASRRTFEIGWGWGSWGMEYPFSNCVFLLPSDLGVNGNRGQEGRNSYQWSSSSTSLSWGADSSQVSFPKVGLPIFLHSKAVEQLVKWLLCLCRLWKLLKPCLCGWRTHGNSCAIFSVFLPYSEALLSFPESPNSPSAECSIIRKLVLPKQLPWLGKTGFEGH